MKENKDEITAVRVTVDAREAVKELIKKHGLNLTMYLSRGIQRAVRERPDFFLPDKLDKPTKRRPEHEG